ncbi:MAG: isoprenylcysteine carboxylmethyltransferase family protein [Methanobrevibacter sp.]|nr:isoprenylcysteine carboxylmethyltransferase family protein [Methanobrevibacter sp.]MBE6490435.1 isoprenylcysteine carboxylmethyltransferase family protein [Methanobrevibacter sp.]
MSENNHLPVFGVGPYLIGMIILITILFFVLSFHNVIPVYKSNQIILSVLGFVLIVVGTIFWLSANVNSRIDDGIRNNQLITTGIYSKVRHPIYAAFLYAVTGAILIFDNLFLIFLPVIFWLILTVVIKNTEEKWLIEWYGDYYLIYSRKVNRFIPKVR